MLSKTIFRDHLVRRRSVILGALVLVMVILSLALRGTVRPETETQIDGLQNVQSAEAITGKNVLWSDKFVNETSWTIQDQSYGTQVSLDERNNSLDLTVIFPQKLASRVDIESPVNLSLDENPFVVANVTVPKGTLYGIKFSGEYPNGTTFQAWNGTSPLQNRTGLGTLETVSASLPTEVYLATRHLPPTGSRITSVLVYIEAYPQTNQRVEMTISGFSAFSYKKAVLSSANASGTFGGLIIKLDPLPQNRKIFEILIGFDVRGTYDLKYIPYFIQNLQVELKGLTYIPKSTISYEEADFGTRQTSAPPLFLNDTGPYVVFAVVAGEMTFFRLDSLVLKLTTQPIVFEGGVESVALIFIELYYLVLLLVIPITFVVLLEKVFRWKRQH